jgi:hypothetical protein
LNSLNHRVPDVLVEIYRYHLAYHRDLLVILRRL